MQPSLKFLNSLFERSFIDKASASRAEAAYWSSGQSMPIILAELGLLNETEIATELARFTGAEQLLSLDADLSSFEVPGISESYVRNSRLIPLEISEHHLSIATDNPLEDDCIRAIEYFTGLQTKTFVVPLSQFSKVFEKLSLSLNTIENVGGDAHIDVDQSDDLEHLRDLASEAPIVKLLSRILSEALRRKATDIHFDVSDKGVSVRYRIDGMLQLVETVSKSQHLALISRIKVLSRLNIAESRLPQDGRLAIPVRGQNTEFRVATAPAIGGESVVLRILDRNEIKLDLEELGFSGDDRSKIASNLMQRSGILLVTGPTGSGKTTTLYAALKLLEATQQKIFTVEDPVEYHLSGITQVQVKPQIGLDFATVLRSVLRQDPDVILIGEIRDAETAKIAVQAALTGHLVLATLHTNSASSTVTRLRDLGIENYLISSTLKAVLAQRLVRKSCYSCLGKSANCSVCNGTGFSGRTTLYELLEIGAEICDAINSGATDLAIEKIAIAKQFKTMRDRGSHLVKQKVSTQNEVLRVLGQDLQ